MTPTEKIDAALASVLTCVGLKSDTVIPQSMIVRWLCPKCHNNGIKKMVQE